MYYLTLGQCQLYLGQTDQAQHTFSQGRELARANVEAGLRESQSQGFLASYEAYLGNSAAAHQAIERSLADAATDLFYGIRSRETLARIHVVLNEKDAAFALLEELLATPYFTRLSPFHLKLDPCWEPLRDDPRFQQLLTAHHAQDS